MTSPTCSSCPSALAVGDDDLDLLHAGDYRGMTARGHRVYRVPRVAQKTLEIIVAGCRTDPGAFVEKAEWQPSGPPARRGA
jgi:hypothetical protein